MQRKHLYLFNETSIAMNYGIGSYIDHLIDCISNKDIGISLIMLDAQEKKIQITENLKYTKVIIPIVDTTNELELKCYYRNVVFILRDIISPDEKNIFHLNYMTNYYLSFWINEILKVKPVLTVHYTDWSFSLMGDIKLLKSILNSSVTKHTRNKDKGILIRIKQDKQFLDSCEKIITIAHHSYNYILQLSSEYQYKLSLIPNALKDCYIKLSSKKRDFIRKKYFINDETKMIIFAGRLDEVKGVAYIIQAFRKVLITHPNCHLFIAGNGNFQKNMLETRKIWTKISFTGLITKQQLSELYSIADLGIIGSLHEEFGLVAIEMMMHALPVVTTNTSGLSEIFEDNVTALKVDIIKKKGKRKPNITVLAEKMIQIINDPVLAKKMGNNSRTEFLRKYESHIYKDKMWQFYNDL